MSLENVKAFYERLAIDEAFSVQIQAVKSKNECRQIVISAGYDFTKQEFEEYTAQLLESTTDSDIEDLEQKELEAVIGGGTLLIGARLALQQPYGVVERYF